MNILVVDDAGIMRMILKDILVRYGGFDKNRIHEAGTGQEAIKKYKQVQPAFMLCDIAMPEGNGVDVVKAVTAMDPDACIIMCTASGEESDVRECVRAGAKGYIVKPPKPEVVIQAVEKVLGKNAIPASVAAPAAVVADTPADTPSEAPSDAPAMPAPQGDTPDYEAENAALRAELAALKAELERVKNKQ